MTDTVDVAALPLAPRNPLPPLQQMKAARVFTPVVKRCVMRAARVTRCSLARAWPLPTFVVTTSPRGCSGRSQP